MTKKIIDLHSHSLYSDGSDSPAELIEKAKAAGLSALSLTDHDTVKGVPYAIEAAVGSDLEIIPGVELTTFYKKQEIHIVGLYVDHTDKKFLSALDHIRFLREERNRKMCSRLHIMGVDIDYDDLIYIYRSNTITRAHIANYLLENGYIDNYKEAFVKYIGDESPAFIQWEKISAQDGIRLILEAGGVPVLAHPVAYKMEDYELEDMLEVLIASGLMGMEVYYSTNSQSFTERSKNICRKYDLIMSGGSDYHGRTKPLISLAKGMGGLRVPYDLIYPIRDASEHYKKLHP